MRREKPREVLGLPRVTQLWFLTPRPKQTGSKSMGSRTFSTRMGLSIPPRARVRH